VNKNEFPKNKIFIFLANTFWNLQTCCKFQNVGK